MDPEVAGSKPVIHPIPASDNCVSYHALSLPLSDWLRGFAILTETVSDQAYGTGGLFLATRDYIVKHYPNLTKNEKRQLKQGTALRDEHDVPRNFQQQSTAGEGRSRFVGE